MDYKIFIEQLPGLFENWGQDSVRPTLDQFQQVLKKIPEMTTASMMQLLNFAVDCMEPNDIYQHGDAKS